MVQLGSYYEKIYSSSVLAEVGHFSYARTVRSSFCSRILAETSMFLIPDETVILAFAVVFGGVDNICKMPKCTKKIALVLFAKLANVGRFKSLQHCLPFCF